MFRKPLSTEPVWEKTDEKSEVGFCDEVVQTLACWTTRSSRFTTLSVTVVSTVKGILTHDHVDDVKGKNVDGEQGEGKREQVEVSVVPLAHTVPNPRTVVIKAVWKGEGTVLELWRGKNRHVLEGGRFLCQLLHICGIKIANTASSLLPVYFVWSEARLEQGRGERSTSSFLRGVNIHECKKKIQDQEIRTQNYCSPFPGGIDRNAGSNLDYSHEDDTYNPKRIWIST